MRISTVVHQDMQVAQCVRSKRLPKVFDQFAVEIADLWGWHLCLENQKGPAAKIDGARDQSLFHWQNHMAVTPDSVFVTQALIHRLPKADADVLGSMMCIHLQITYGMDIEIHQSVSGEQNKHVVEKADAGMDVILTGTIQGQL